MTGHAADKFSGTNLVSISVKARDLADSAIIAYWTENYGRGIDFHRREAIAHFRKLADLCGFDLVDRTTEATDRRTAEMNAELPQEAADLLKLKGMIE